MSGMGMDMGREDSAGGGAGQTQNGREAKGAVAGYARVNATGITDPFNAKGARDARGTQTPIHLVSDDGMVLRGANAGFPIGEGIDKVPG